MFKGVDMGIRSRIKKALTLIELQDSGVKKDA